MTAEAIPTLRPVPGIDLHQYARQLIERFSNPEVRDTVARLCANTSDCIPKFLLPVIRQQLAAGGPFTRSAAVVASWARYAEGADENGEPHEIDDVLAPQLQAAARTAARAPGRVPRRTTARSSANWPTTPGSPGCTARSWPPCSTGASGRRSLTLTNSPTA